MTPCVYIAVLFVAAVLSHRVQEGTESDNDATFPTTRQRRECKVCQANWGMLQEGPQKETSNDKIAYFYGSKQTKMPSTLQTQEAAGQFQCPFTGREAGQCRDFYAVLIDKAQIPLCWHLTEEKQFCGCVANRKEGPSCPDDDAGEVKPKDTKPDAGKVKPKNTKPGKKEEKITEPVETKDQDEDMPAPNDSGFSPRQLNHCKSCVSRWEVFKDTVLATGRGSMKKKVDFFQKGQMESLLADKRKLCPKQTGDCVDMLNFLGKKSAAICYQEESLNTAQSFCGCIAAKKNSGKLCP